EEREMHPYCQAEGVAVIPWSPLARGRLTRDPADESGSKRAGTDANLKTFYGPTEAADRQIIDAVATIAKERHVPRAQVALPWQLHKPAVTAPIVGATKPEHLEDAVKAISLKLTSEEMAALEDPYVPHAFAGFV